MLLHVYVLIAGDSIDKSRFYFSNTSSMGKFQMFNKCVGASRSFPLPLPFHYYAPLICYSSQILCMIVMHRESTILLKSFLSVFTGDVEF